MFIRCFFTRSLSPLYWFWSISLHLLNIYFRKGKSIKHLWWLHDYHISPVAVIIWSIINLQSALLLISAWLIKSLRQAPQLAFIFRQLAFLAINNRLIINCWYLCLFQTFSYIEQNFAMANRCLSSSWRRTVSHGSSFMIFFMHFGRLTSHAVVTGILGKPKEGKIGTGGFHPHSKDEMLQTGWTYVLVLIQ